MKTSKAVVILLACVLSAPEGRAAPQAAPAGSQVPDAFLIAADRAGSIEIGALVDDIYQGFGHENVRLVADFREGQFQPVLQVTLRGSKADPALAIDIRELPCGEFRASRIQVLDDRFRTREGFGIGSTGSELRRAHPFVMIEEEGAHAAWVKDLQLTFALTREGPVDQQRVTSVGIPGDPMAVKKKWCPGIGRQAPRVDPGAF